MFQSGAARIDEERRELTVDGDARHLEPQAFDLLVYLVRHADRVVAKEELLDEVWGDQFVSESALTTRIKEIRKALGDNGTEQRLVKNVRGRGYRFVGPLDQPAATGTPRSHLVGREDDLAAIDEHLGAGAVVTVVGPGGVGKTSLALDVARRVRDRLPDGLRIVRLAQVREPDDVVHAVRLEAVPETDGSVAETVAGLDGLVVIDNGEHVIGAVASFVDAVLAHGGPVRILVTSRERLGVSAEQVWPLAPLGPDAARRLLVSRAEASRPGFTLDPDDDEAVDALLTAVDHLPLGIEMAAPHLASIGARDLAAALTERLDLLQAPNRGVDERHQSLTNLVEWSTRLLADDARRTLVDLTVFAGPASLPDLAAVLDRSEAELAFGALTELVDRSLVVADTLRQPTTYRLLETVRSTSAAERDPDVDRRHAEHVAATVHAADSLMRRGDDIIGAARIDALVSDVRVAHRWARANEPALARTIAVSLYQYTQERQWPEPALWWSDAQGEPLDDAPEIAAILAANAANRGDYDRAVRLAEVAAAADDPRVRASGIDSLTNVALYRGDTATAIGHGETLVELGDAEDDGYIRTIGVLGIVLGELYGGGTDRAHQLLDAHRPHEAATPTSQAWLAYADGEIATMEGRLDDAVSHYEDAIDAAHTVGNRFVIGVSEVSRLAALARGGELTDALSAYAPVLTRYRRLQNHTHAVTALRNVVSLLVRAGDDEAAMAIVGALTRQGTKTTYGAESIEIDGAVADATARHGADVVEGWIGSGATQATSWALDRAIEAVEALRTTAG